MSKKKPDKRFFKFLIVWITVLGMSALEVITRRSSLFIMGTIVLFVLVPIIVDRYVNRSEWGILLVHGLPLVFLWLVVFIIILILSNSHPVLDKILLWPVVQ